MSDPVYLIVGASRGIGFALLKKTAQENPQATIIATARDVSKSIPLQEFAEENSRIKLVSVEVSSAESIGQLGVKLAKVAPDGIDYLLYNAGISKSSFPVLQATRDDWLKHYETNTVGPIEVFKVVYPFLKKRDTKVALFTSSLAGSIGGYFPFPSSAYGQSKAALNYSIVELSHELQPEGFTIVATHPGIVRTDMVSDAFELVPKDLAEQLLGQSISPEESADGLYNYIISGAKQETHNGKFLQYDGNEIPW
jgi:NAD(P)-dependent dehydrogenase (short-subunit alcohol dehydrogenase family)